ncbi:MAG: hypothetical protein K9J27_01050 [Bacteroidales bacterium]|nr:hypothetical protein [Bacteroidales bacterium]MCF8332550.1 hypothetical protein [Bacteroidales bacterium]
MIIIVDTNIVFSGILNTKSTIGDLLLNSDIFFRFWSCHYLIKEIDNNWEKLKRISNLDEEALLKAKNIVFKKINFIDESKIPKKHRLKAYDLVKNIDPKDIAFVALNESKGSLLWTGDMALFKGLLSLKYDKMITTAGMKDLRNTLEEEQF